MNDLRATAERLYKLLKDSGPMWEDQARAAMFPPVVFSKENKPAYYEYMANVYGRPEAFIIDGIEYTAAPTVEVPYNRVISQAYQLLRKEGRAGERNNGYNSYVFYAK